MKTKSFFFHYNKPASQRSGKQQISVHYNKTCHIVDNIVCKVFTEGRLRNTQPKFVMIGKCNSLTIENGIATIL